MAWGGYNAGEVASGITVSVMPTEISNVLHNASAADRDKDSGEKLGVVLLRENVQKANLSIYHAAQSQPQYAGMGTTVVAGLFYDNRLTSVHVGDSRLYRLRGELFVPITRDHSVLQEQLDSGVISQQDARLSRIKTW